MKKILIIGASVLQLPAIKKAKELGHHVAVADFNPNAVGVSFADEYFNVSTVDEQAICDVAKYYNPDGIMTLATDMPMRAIAKATTLLGLCGISYETAIKATDKGQMIQAFEKHNVAIPWYHVVESVRQLSRKELSYPLIIKPTDNAGSRGVTLVDAEENLDAAFAYSISQSRSGKVILEEYMQGPEVSVEVMVINNEPFVLSITDKLTTGAPHFVEMGHNQPSLLDESTQHEIIVLAKKAVKAVGINCGPAHVEMIITNKGPKMVELGARMGGDCITTHLVPLSTGIDMVKATIDVSLGLIPNITPIIHKASAIRFFSGCNGIIHDIINIDVVANMDGVKEVVLNKNIGDSASEIKSSVDRIGAVVTQAEDANTAIEIADKAVRTIEIDSF